MTSAAIAPAPSLRACAVDKIKRRALAHLHATPRGEARIVEMYLWAEESAETAGLAELAGLALPPWLHEQMQSHLGDERRHVDILRGQMRRLGYVARPPVLDLLSRLKLARMRRDALGASHCFRSGKVASLLAIAYVMEAMGVRFMSRHVEVLRELPATSARSLRPALEAILRDERRHVALCHTALLRLTSPDEYEDLLGLVARLEEIDRSWGVAGALGLLAVSCLGGGP